MLVTWLARDQSAPAPMREVATVRGQRAELRFPDGTRITLAADSRLRFPGVFKGRTRDVYLEGEALFRVTHDPARPFLVRAAGSVTEDLGTEFGLKAYPGTGHVQVVVAEGKVALRPGTAPSSGGLVLTSNQLGRLTPDGQGTITDHVDVDRYLGWSRGRLAFDVEFEIPDSAVAARHLTASFGQEPLPDVLRIITLSLDIRYERVGGTVVFLAKHAVASHRLPSLKSDSGGNAP
jgi:transmembrane sensor